jgi:dsDNA-binding SOS-regulon protein
MAVIAVWKCDRDGAMFDDKKAAEEHDKMLELAESIAGLLNRNIAEISEELSQEVGILLARHRDELAKACKGKPEALAEVVAEESTAQATDNVATLAGGS